MISDLPHRDVQRPAALELYLIDCQAQCDFLEGAEARVMRLSEDERQRTRQIEASRGHEEARLWRAAHIGLRIVLERFCGPAVRGVAFATTASGRPFLRDAGADAAGPGLVPLGSVEFSLAHAGTMALIGVACGQAIGVDIEVSRDVNVSAERRQRIEAIAGALSPGQPLSGDGDARFLLAWVRLEALAKATGMGIGRLLTAAGVVGGSRSEADFGGGRLGQVLDLDAGAGRFAAVAAASLPKDVAIAAFPATEAEIAEFLQASAGQ